MALAVQKSSSLVYVDGGIREHHLVADYKTAGVIGMDVRDHDALHVRDVAPNLGEAALQRAERVVGVPPGVHQVRAAVGLEHVDQHIPQRVVGQRDGNAPKPVSDLLDVGERIIGGGSTAGPLRMRRRGRVRKIIERTDRMAVVFPFEADLYSKAGSKVTFVGHPLLDRVHPAQPRKETLARHQLPPASRLITILPGSRRSEIGFLLQPMVEAARIMARDHGLIPCLALAPTLGESDLKAVSGADLEGIRIIKEDSYSVVAVSEVALVASGTATLETALLECPMVIAYKLKPISYLVAWTLVTGVKNIGMPNILAGRTIVPELIQSQVTATNLVRAAEDLLIESNRSKLVNELKALRTALGAPGAPARVAQMALDMIHD